MNKKESKIEKLWEYAALEGCEHGDYWTFIADIAESCCFSCQSKTFVEAVWKEVDAILEDLETNWAITEETKEETKVYVFKTLEYIGE